MKEVLCYTHNYELNRDEIRHVNLDKHVEFTNDLEYFKKATTVKRVALIQPPVTNEYEIVRNIMDQISDVDHIIFYTIELNDHVYDLIIEHDWPNVSYVLNGYINYDMQYAKIYPQIFWIISIRHFYYNLRPGLIKQKHQSYVRKVYDFEVMYGLERRHRLYTHKKIQEIKNHKQKFFEQPMLKIGTHIPDGLENRNNIWEDEIEWNGRDTHVRYFGREMALSEVVPFKIYKQAAYSLICETNFNNMYSFFTEKITKPIMTERLFIIISGQYYLKNLRRLGFKTFDGIIDESYDLEPDHEKRWDMALAEADKLCKRDQIEVLKKCAPILMHNFRRLKELPFTKCEDLFSVLMVELL